LKLANADDYVRFARDDVPKFAEVYRFIKNAEDQIVSGFEHIYYNAVRRYGFQSMVLLSAVEVGDTTTDWKRKIGLGARLLDLLLTTRTIEGKENNYDNLKDISFSLAREIRVRSGANLLTFIRTEWAKHANAIGSLAELRA
jgi:hypothetical protein